MASCTRVRCYIVVSGPANLVISVIVILVLFDVFLNIIFEVITIVICKFVRFFLFNATYV
jgi:hypothetical protein